MFNQHCHRVRSCLSVIKHSVFHCILCVQMEVSVLLNNYSNSPHSVWEGMGLFRYDRRIWLQSRMIRSQEISCADGPDSNNWKIPWNKIMIKRKIGKGAFGEVYSGEALLEHSAWVPVAVKILKPGSSIENQNDFLNEVQAMKRFDHSNIVKLLGIYNKSGSVRLVMEFMVHGDLKTYLLNRRHLRKELRLTRMALDVSKALTYLSELKYVHR